LKWLSVVDEFTRECLLLKVARSITGEDVKGDLIRLLRERGVPDCIRSDNGAEFIAGGLRSWLERAGVGTLYVEPGAPWENGYAEAFHGRLRDELLKTEEFGCVKEAQALARAWKEDYNRRRPHSALGYRAPAEFAAAWAAPGLGSLALPHPTPLTEEALITLGT
jgi:transposase InsO family protein